MAVITGRNMCNLHAGLSPKWAASIPGSQAFEPFKCQQIISGLMLTQA
jgi:hypothetical protein